ncbi:MAG: TadE family protein [Planctomycetota bacterium]
MSKGFDMGLSRIQFVRKSIIDLIDQEDGGAYTLSYVMVTPFLMLFTCLVVETTLVMNAKVGTVYAAYSGARTAVVWSSADDNWSDTENRIELAAKQSFVPFASGMGNEHEAPDHVAQYLESHASFVKNGETESYLRNKFANAANRLKVTVDGPPTSHDSDITVTVEYRFQFNIPGIGKLIGQKDGVNYFFPLTSTATLQNEGPKNEHQDIGIGYGKLD